MMVEDGEHRVLQFRSRASVPSQGSRSAGARVQAIRDQAVPDETTSEPYDLSRYERIREEEPDDFHHRILANIAALAFTFALTAVAIWLAMSISNLRRTQDCELMGRNDCTHIFKQEKYVIVDPDLFLSAGWDFVTVLYLL